MKNKKGKFSIKEMWGKHKVLIISIAFILIILLVMFGAKIFLYANFLLGNDVIVKLNVDKNHLEITKTQGEEITFITTVTTNPFCKAQCDYTFTDISGDIILDKNNFTIRPAMPYQQEYMITTDKRGEGLDLYRFDVNCKSQGTALCHTSEVPTTRSILITASYDLTEEEQELKNKSREKIDELTNKIIELKNILSSINNTIDNSEYLTIDEMEMNILYNQVEKDIVQLKVLKVPWNKQDFYAFSQQVLGVEAQINDTETKVKNLRGSIGNLVNEYNNMIDDFYNISDELAVLKTKRFAKVIHGAILNNAIQEFNSALVLFKYKGTIEEKQQRVRDKLDNVIDSIEFLKEDMDKEALKIKLETDISYDILCDVTDNCVSHASISDRAEETELGLVDSCNYVEGLKLKYVEIDTLIPEKDYPTSETFFNEISQKIKNLREETIIRYLFDLPQDKNNTELIKEILVRGPIIPTSDFIGYDLTRALFDSLVEQTYPCELLSFESGEVSLVDLNKIKMEESSGAELEVIFQEPLPQCCVFGECGDCCVTEKCINDDSKYPVIFLHGHAFNKDTSAEYSLEGFNKIQEKLEDDGYLSAGTVTIFTKEKEQGKLGWPNVPLTIRTSYYFDIFKEPENYVVVQTKSESIDSYAIRLKDIIDTIKYQTGKPKVKVVAYSMGGLVARRYVQLFGENDVDRLVLIATPNNGIVGNVLDYCPFVGEKLECRDMNSESLFINKLNREALPSISITNIVGLGCVMDEGQGDGVVLEDHAYLEGAKNYLINGTCLSKTKPLHVTIRDIDTYSDVYDIVKAALE